MSKEKITFAKYRNAIVARAKNKRILLAKEEENLLIELTNFNTMEEFKVVGHKKLRKNLHVNGIKLTPESAEMLFVALRHYLQEFQPIHQNPQ